MKITHNKVGTNLNLSDSSKTDKVNKPKSGGATALSEMAAGSSKASEGASVNLSERAQDVMKAKEIAMAAPDVREDRVAELQKMIDAGKYKVDAKDIADKMVDEESQWA
jgi:negative regulator of flagellin synthesis FlgM